jgi:hypothetical protein
VQLIRSTKCRDQTPSLAKSANAGEAVDLVDDDHVNPASADVIKEPQERRPLRRPPEWPPSPLPVPMNFPPSWRLALQVGSRGLPLIVERVELLLQAMLGRNTGLDGAGSRISRRCGLSALPAPRRTNERHLRVCGRELARRPRQASRLAVIIAGKQFCLGARSARKARCSTPWSSHDVTRSPYPPIHELHRLDDVRLRSMTTLWS